MSTLQFDCGCEFNVNDGKDASNIIDAETLNGGMPSGVEVDIYDIPRNCERTWDLICSGRTTGVFQLESSLGKTWAKKVKPRNLEEMAALISIIRPGCLHAKFGDPPKSVTNHFCDRKHGLEQVTYMHPAMEKALGNTYGINCYQEQSMQLASTLAGFSLQQADILRKCLAEGSWVYTQNGPRTIEDICDNKKLSTKILTVDSNNKLVYRKIKKVWRTGQQKTYTLKTEKGYKIRLTQHHQVFTQDGWKELQDIKTGDFVAIPKKYTYKGNSKKISIDDAIILSYVISEGCHQSGSTKITNSDPWILQTIRDITHRLNIKTSEQQHNNGCVDIYILAEYRKKIEHILPHAKSRNKIIPSCILNATNGITRAFVGHYFSAEGSVSQDNIEISSTSQSIIEALQALLLRDGIHSCFQIKNSTYKNKPYVSYRLFVCDNQNITKFFNTYQDYICPNKKQSLINLIATHDSYSNSRFLVPSCFVKAATQGINLSGILCDVSGTTYNGNLTYDRANRINQILQSPLLHDVLCSEFYFTKVSDIVDDDVVTTYDYEVDDPDIHYGFVNGILVHNSIGKKKADIMASLEKDFVEGCKKQGLVTEEQAKEIFDGIRQSQNYAFNKSHAITYGLTGYWTAYLKAHFPVQFYCSFLHGAQWKQEVEDEVYTLVNDAKLNNVTVNPPCLLDKKDSAYVKNNEVYFGLADIKQIGEASLVKVHSSLSQCPKDISSWKWLDYLTLFSSTVSSTVNEALICCGAVDFLRKDRTLMMYEYEVWSQLTSKEQEWCQKTILEPHLFDGVKQENLTQLLRSCAKPKKEGGGCSNKNRVEKVESLLSLLESPPHSLRDTADFIAWSEERYLGAPLTCHKVDSCECAIEANATCKEVVLGRGGYTVLAVEVKRVNEIKTTKGKTPGRKMAFLSIVDGSCALDDVVVFPDAYKKFAALLYDGNTVLVQGERTSQGSFSVNNVIQI